MRKMVRALYALAFGFSLSASLLAVEPVTSEQDFIPRRQDKPPGPALEPAEAIKKMTVPEGFSVELVASEPNIVNPVAMTIDERGRFWITESLEYPRKSAGKGRDRIKVAEDTDGDGTADKFTIFAEGLNIPSGIAVGYGGVWVANAPDILFLQDTNGDGKADKQEVVVTGFGRDDTHELPNSLTWGPDGWLYGLNGVFNYSQIKHQGKQFDFTCAMFRFHPRTREFQVFCEGTSNPWGIAWDAEGSAFVSACVIDHLWHLTESAYYHRQGGPYPPYTWKLESIVKHQHQLAAYCGIHYFDSEAYPAKYRDKLYMGNIHAGGINADKVVRDGSTYFGTTEPDFMMANDVWFMPVVQKTGPDGCLYILDWYDRYHCYQDANRDPAGIDRLRGRLYRVRYNGTPRAKPFDLSKETNQQLVERLHSTNVYFRDLAQRLLTERLDDATRAALEKLVMNDSVARKTRMHALWVLVSSGKLPHEFHRKLLAHTDDGYRAWGVRAAGNFGQVDKSISEAVVAMAADKSPDVRLQVAIAARKIEGLQPVDLLLAVLTKSGEDRVIPSVVWQNLHPLLEKENARFLELVSKPEIKQSAAYKQLMPRAVERILGAGSSTAATIAALFNTVSQGEAVDQAAAKNCLSLLANKVQNGELQGDRLQAVRKEMEPMLRKIFAAEGHPLLLNAALLATAWKDSEGTAAIRKLLSAPNVSEGVRLEGLQALIAGKDESALAIGSEFLKAGGNGSLNLRAATLASLGRLDDPHVAGVVLGAYDKLDATLQPRAIELLTQRPTWSKALLEAVGSGQIPPSALNVNQVRKLLTSGDAEVVALVTARWGAVRTERNPQREQVIMEVKALLSRKQGDPHKGQEVFRRVCAQCHKIYGEGQEVGPDITQIGRTSTDLLLSNVLDPSLVIGAVYQATSVRTSDGRALTGIVVENSDERLGLKLQGGKVEVIPRDDIEEQQVSKLSMMPEELEKQLKEEELVDLFAFLSLDKPPSDPSARRLPQEAQQ